MAKFKVGERVTCIKDRPDTADYLKGSGYRAGYRFVIGNITNEFESYPVYWPKEGGNGIYEHELEGMDWDG
jgi:hypothetical protein